MNGNSSAEFLVKFTSKGSAVEMAWGGHLAQSAFWNLAAGGQRDGAGEVSGAPWHMRTLQLDGAGNRNQDRSIQPSAIVGELPPFALAPPTPKPKPTPTPQAPRPRDPGVLPPPANEPNAPAGGPTLTPPATSTLTQPEPRDVGPSPGTAAALVLISIVILAATRAQRRPVRASRRTRD